MDDMRGCHAAVIHVGLEGMLYDQEGNEHPQVNGNVLIEIGAAMALYGRNFILLVEEGVKLPSNLQGLYECRYRACCVFFLKKKGGERDRRRRQGKTGLGPFAERRTRCACSFFRLWATQCRVHSPTQAVSPRTMSRPAPWVSFI